MYYLDFSALLTLAVGFNAVYVMAKSKSDNRLFFLLLDKISEVIKNINERIRMAITKISTLAPRIDYFKQHTTIHTAEKFSKKENKIMASAKKIRSKHSELITIEKQCNSLEHNACNTNNLYKIASISLLYSLCVLVLAVYERRCVLNLNDSLVIPNILISVFALICLLGDWSYMKKHLNKILFIIFIIGIAVVLFEVSFSIKYNHIYTIAACFIGFIFYFLATTVGYLVSKWYYYRRTVCIEKEIDEIEKMIEEHLKKEDSELEKEIMGKDVVGIRHITINGFPVSLRQSKQDDTSLQR
jgi:hypothetical protein